MVVTELSLLELQMGPACHHTRSAWSQHSLRNVRWMEPTEISSRRTGCAKLQIPITRLTQGEGNDWLPVRNVIRVSYWEGNKDQPHPRSLPTPRFCNVIPIRKEITWTQILASGLCSGFKLLICKAISLSPWGSREVDMEGKLSGRCA